tara:strand:+ start:83 stop:412 length:330 start_codon:yes stop_codon:yes gene_type:complete
MSNQQVLTREFDDFLAQGGGWYPSLQGLRFQFNAHFPIEREYDPGDPQTHPPGADYYLYDYITVDNVLCFDDDGDAVGLNIDMLEQLQKDVRAKYAEDEGMFADMWISN